MRKSKSSMFSRQEGQWCDTFIEERRPGRRMRNLRGVNRQIELLNDWRDLHKLDPKIVEQCDETINMTK